MLFDHHQEMDAWYKTKFQDLNTASTRHVESVRGIREEVVSHKKDVSTLLHLLFSPWPPPFVVIQGSNCLCVCVSPQIQYKQQELDALNTRYETLLAQIRDNQEKYKKTEEDLQVRWN